VLESLCFVVFVLREEQGTEGWEDWNALGFRLTLKGAHEIGALVYPRRTEVGREIGGVLACGDGILVPVG